MIMLPIPVQNEICFVLTNTSSLNCNYYNYVIVTGITSLNILIFEYAILDKCYFIIIVKRKFLQISEG